MDFFCRLYYSNINWHSKKVFFDSNIKDKCLIKLLVFKGISIVYSRNIADIIIVRHHQSCWWSWKEISLNDLYYILSDADKYLYYIWSFKRQYQPKAPSEKCFFIHNYMVVLDFSKKNFNIYCRNSIPFIDQKIYTKHLIKDKSYLKIWVGDYFRSRTTNYGDSLLIQISENKYMIIRDAICVFENNELCSKMSIDDSPSAPFLMTSRYNWAKIFQTKTVSCKIIHQQH